MSMNQGLATVLAAFLAALLALAGIVSNLLLEKGRRRQIHELELERREVDRLRDTTSWLRQELHRNAVLFLDALFAMSSLSGKVAGFSKAIGDASRREITANLIAAHEELKSAQTVLRLLAPAELVQVIEDCHEAHDALFEIAANPQQPIPLRQEWERLVDAARAGREKFIGQVRAPLGLGAYDHRIRRYPDTSRLQEHGS